MHYLQSANKILNEICIWQMSNNQGPTAYNGISTDFIYAGQTDLIGGD